MSKTIVAITVDTEFSTHKEDMGILGRIDGKEYGLPKFMELMRLYNFKGTFFVDVYTNKKEYVPALKKVCLQLKDNGHDLQLHTHPIHMYESKGIAMKDYGESEQRAIIQLGVETFKEWFGEHPIAHRTGDWGANRVTLDALNKFNFKVDSSMFYGWENCQLNKMSLTKNRIVKYQGLWEVPASVFECVGLGVFSPYRLLSTDGNSFEETWSMLKKLQESGVTVINTVYHSFSFIKWNKERTQYWVDENRIRKFELFLRKLSEDDTLEVKTIKQIAEDLNKNNDLMPSGEDVIPKSGLGASLIRLADRLASR